ncbi:hypothetical protein Emag_000239 [Eimeria magna]
MGAERGGPSATPRFLHSSSSSSSSLAFIDVAFSDSPLAADGDSDGGGGLPPPRRLQQQRSRAGAAAQRDDSPPQLFHSRSCGPGCRGSLHQHRLDSSAAAAAAGRGGLSSRQSLATRFFLRDLMHGEAQGGGIDSDDEARSICSTDCIEVVLSGYPSSSSATHCHHHQHQQQQQQQGVAVFYQDPAAAARRACCTEWRLLWGLGCLLLLFGLLLASAFHLAYDFVFNLACQAEGIGPTSSNSNSNSSSSSRMRGLEGGVFQVRSLEWVPAQIASDSLYMVLVMSSLAYISLLVQRRLRVAVFLRFVSCWLVCVGLKILFSLAAAFAFMAPTRLLLMDDTAGSSSKAEAAVLLLRFLLGLSLPEAADPLPGYSRVVTCQLLLFWCLYSWQSPLLLLHPAALAVAVLVLGSAGGLRSVLDLLLAFFVSSVVTLGYHCLLDAAARRLFLKLRQELGTHESLQQQQQQQQQQKVQQEHEADEAQQQQELNACVYTPANGHCCGLLRRENACLKGTRMVPPAYFGFFSSRLKRLLVDACGRLEGLELRVRFTLRSLGLKLAQQRGVCFVLPPNDINPQQQQQQQQQQREEQDQGLPVLPSHKSLAAAAAAAAGAAEAGGTGVRVLFNDRLLWLAVCDCYLPQQLSFCGLKQLLKGSSSSSSSSSSKPPPAGCTGGMFVAVDLCDA